MDNLEQINKVLTAVAEKIEQLCGLKNPTFILALLLNYIDTKTWTFDRALFAKLYQIMEIIEQDADLRMLFGAEEAIKNENKSAFPQKG